MIAGMVDGASALCDAGASCGVGPAGESVWKTPSPSVLACAAHHVKARPRSERGPKHSRKARAVSAPERWLRRSSPTPSALVAQRCSTTLRVLSLRGLSLGGRTQGCLWSACMPPSVPMRTHRRRQPRHPRRGLRSERHAEVATRMSAAKAPLSMSQGLALRCPFLVVGRSLRACFAQVVALLWFSFLAALCKECVPLVWIAPAVMAAEWRLEPRGTSGGNSKQKMTTSPSSSATFA